MPNRAPDRPEVPSLRQRKGSELRLSRPALVGLMRAVLARGRSFRFRAKGWSMSPFIRDGDVITIAPSGRKPKAPVRGIGQVVAFVSPVNERLVVHRIIGRHQSRFLIQGDNLPGLVADTVRLDDILGRVVRIERGGKRVWLGPGLERYAIAILSRTGLLLPMRYRASALTRLLRKLRNDDN